MAVSEEGAARQKMPERVLIVDDDKNVLDAYRRRLGRALHVEVCDDPVEALQLLEHDNEYAVIISDFLMPKLNGVQFLSKCKQKSPHSVRMMLTGIADFGTSVDAVNAGSVFRFLIKPCPPEVLGQALVDGIRQYRLEQAEGNLLRNTLREAILLAVDIAAVADPATFADTRRLTEAVRAVATELDPDRSAEIEIAWLLSGFGQLTVPADILARHRSGSGLSADEAALIEKCAHASVELTQNIPQLETIAAMIEGNATKVPKGKRLPTTASTVGSAIVCVFRGIAALKAAGVEDTDLAARLREEDAGYDPRVLKAVDTYFGNRGGAFPAPVSVEELKAGDVLVTDVRTADGRVLAGAGTQLSHLLVERIRNFAAVRGVNEPVSVLQPGVTVELE